MWLNEKVMAAATETLSHNEEIRAMQVEAWQEYMDGAGSTALIESGLKRIRAAIKEMYKPGDLITSYAPDDPVSPMVYLLIKIEDNDWIALCEGQLQRLPTRFWLVEDHTLLSTSP